MPLRRLNMTATLVLLIFIVGAAMALLYQSLTTPGRTEQINLYTKQLAMGSKIDDSISNLTANSQMYILYGDKEYLKAFRFYNAKALDEGLEFYNVATSNNKPNIELVLTSSRAYIDFVENEVLPIMQLDHPDSREIKYLQIRNSEFGQQLKQQVAEINKTSAAELSGYYQDTVIGTSKKMGLSVIVILLALLLLLGSLYSTTISLSLQHFYLRRLADKTDQALLVVDRNGVFKEINHAASSIFNIPPGEFLESAVNDTPYLFPHLQGLIQPIHAVMLDKRELTNQSLAYYYAGKKVTLKVDYIPVINNKQRLIGTIVIANIAQAQRDSVLLDTLEAERKRISIEIHDWIARYLSALIHSVDYILRRPNMKADELKGHLFTMRDYCQNGAIEMRGIMNNIHPYLIDKIGLVSALESYVNTYEELNNIKVYVFYQRKAINISNNKKIIIYRIIQEALSNIAKHSTATEVDIHLTMEKDTLRIEIEDNGGSGGEFVAGKGMWGMKERANLIGGEINFEYSDTGFCVTLKIPIQQEEHNGED